jgi:hypothetical protein
MTEQSWISVAASAVPGSDDATRLLIGSFNVTVEVLPSPWKTAPVNSNGMYRHTKTSCAACGEVVHESMSPWYGHMSVSRGSHQHACRFGAALP